MSAGSNIDELVKNLNTMGKEHVKVQTCWATCKSVNWADKTMVAIGEIDELDYFDVQLGVGSLYRRPKVGTMCLLGVIENKEAATFLIDADEVEEFKYTSGGSEFTVKEAGYIIKRGNQSFKTVMNEMQSEIGKLCAELNKVVVLMGTGPNVAAIAAIKDKVTGDLTNRFNSIFTA